MKTNHWPLIIGIALPIIFIIIIALVAFTPSFYIKPAHNFIYSQEPTYDYSYDYSYGKYQNTYKVINGRIALQPLATSSRYGYDTGAALTYAPTLYLYDVKTDTTREISFEEAKGYTVDVGPASVDGYTVSYQYGHSGIFELFGSNNENRGYFIMKDGHKKKLEGFVQSGYSYSSYGQFRFIGWIK